jgi:hypothetical protein
MRAQVKQQEVLRKAAQQRLAEECKAVDMMNVDLSLLPQADLQAIGGPGFLQLKVKKRLRTIEENPEETKRVGGHQLKRQEAKSNAFYKQVLLHTLAQSDKRLQTLDDCIQSYQREYDILISCL